MLKLATFSWYLHSDLQTGCFSRNMEASKQNWYSQNWHHVFNFKRCAVISWHQQRALLRMERMTTTNLNFLCCSFAGCNESRIKQRKPALLPTGRNFLSNVKKDEQMRWHFCFRHVCQQLRRSWISECDRFPYDSSARNLSQILADMEIFAKWKKNYEQYFSGKLSWFTTSSAVASTSVGQDIEPSPLIVTSQRWGVTLSWRLISSRWYLLAGNKASFRWIKLKVTTRHQSRLIKVDHLCEKWCDPKAKFSLIKLISSLEVRSDVQ